MAQGSGLLLSVSPRAILLFCVAAVVTLTFYTSHTIHLLTDRLDGVTRLNQQLEKKLALASALVKHHSSFHAEPHDAHDPSDATPGAAVVLAAEASEWGEARAPMPFIDGYSAVSAQAAVRAGVDVRLVQDDAPLRPHRAHAMPDPVDIKLDYETCARTIDKGLGAPPIDLSQGPNPKRVHWMHIPKCGSSFGSTLYSLVCQKEPSPNVSPYTGEVCDYCGAAATRGPRWDSVLHATIDFTALPYCNWNVTTSTPRANFRNHVPLPLDHRPQRDWLNVGLFRDPRRRLVSGWNHDKHANGFDERARQEFERSVLTIEDYANHRSIRNCATKMLVGAYCARDRNLTQHAFEEAQRRLHNFAFVGLTDNFDASTCLFCRMYNIKPLPFMFGKHAHARPMEDHAKRGSLPGGGERAAKEHWEQLSVSSDPLDWEIYTTARQIFMARLQQYGLYDIDYRKLERGIQFR